MNMSVQQAGQATPVTSTPPNSDVQKLQSRVQELENQRKSAAVIVPIASFGPVERGMSGLSATRKPTTAATATSSQRTGWYLRAIDRRSRLAARPAVEPTTAAEWHHGLMLGRGFRNRREVV